jgi:CubicO group peptidase (beta-lactamase class C family)
MITGSVAPGFDPVRDAFERCFGELGETGAGFSAHVHGRRVVDLWGSEGFQRDSLVHVYSVTKPMAAFCVLVLLDRGLVGLDDPVTRYWPEFAQAGKGRTTVRQLISHHRERHRAVPRLALRRRHLRGDQPRGVDHLRRQLTRQGGRAQ